ncbi:Cytochrome P450 monooxygenase fsdH [Lachnellula cervina]|uniref:Cytochrome P450 monooxygenase fsdH n=1 Tax=Lachnellula cervina TaxID=1316786 RepID=A0A7D8UXD2_9HELO|nr:Cytochrome P450 monooxygenase fsdH [Lachnellula cervina]
MGSKLNAFIAALIAAVIHYVYRRWTRDIARRESGCQPVTQVWSKEPFFGFDFQMSIHLDLPSLYRRHERLGKSFHVTPLNNISTICTIAPENIRIVNCEKGWGVQPMRLSGMEHFCGRGFLTTDGDIWQHSRKLLKPTFSKHNLIDLSVLSAEVDRLFLEIPEGAQTIDLQPHFYNMFLNTSLHFLLGVHPSDKHAGVPYESEVFIDAFHDAAFRTMLRIMLGRFWALAPKSRYLESCEIAHKFIDHYVDQALEEGPRLSTENSEKAAKQSMAQGLAAQTDDRESIRSQILQGMLASLETTSALLGNSIFLLARHPQYWQHIRAESKQRGSDLLNFDSLLNFKTVQNVLYESRLLALRLYPVFPLLARVALSDATLPVGGGINQTDRVYVPKGSSVVMSYFALHRDPLVFGNDVEDFRPERWESIRPEQWQFMPFGGGNRACLGQQKALVEAAYVLVRMASTFGTLQSRDNAPWKGELKLTCKSANGCKVALVKG